MEDVEPSCGYSVLAQILEKNTHNIVITTNFDSLTEDALFIYTNKKPLVVGHEALAHFVKPLSSRPIIVKIHRDLFLSPKNTAEETSELATNFQEILSNIFQFYTPLVIGSGGNDGSLMGFLEKLPDKMGGGIFWFYREYDGEPNERIKKLIEKLDGSGIAIPGFDDLMIQIGDRLGLERLDGKIVKIAEERSVNYRKQIEKIKEEKNTSADTKKAVNEIISRGTKDWWYYYNLALGEPDLDKRDGIYQDGIEENPGSPELIGNYASFLDNIRKDYDKAEELYKKAIHIDSEDVTNLGNYGLFLQGIRKDYDKAEELYKKAIHIDSEDVTKLGNYGLFLHFIRKDYDKAEELYKKVIQLDPEDPIAFTNYAQNYIAVRNFDKANALIKKAFNLNGEKMNDVSLELWFCRYAIFLDEYKDADKEIEKLLEKGIQSAGSELGHILEVAKELNHPDYKNLCELEKQITKL